MHVAFVSSHVTDDFCTGRLVAQLHKEDLIAGQTLVDEVSFSVPADFHTHNDAVAAALLTLVGTTYSGVTFNFPISRRCADTLAAHYRLDDIGPVAENVVLRQPGKRLGLNFSRGFDSVAHWCLLRFQLNLELRVITSDYGGHFAHEREGFERFQRDVSCVTNLRQRGYDRRGRFNAAVPLLYADYLDLYGLASGHAFRQTPSDSDDFKAGTQPRFLAGEGAYAAGGLREMHLCRGIYTAGMLSIVMQALPNGLEPAMRASASLRSEKGLGKALMLKHLHRRANLPEPNWLARVRVPDARPAPARPDRPTLRGLFAAKFFGLEAATRLIPGPDACDLGFLDNINFDMLERHNPKYVPYIPADLRVRLLAAYSAYGITSFVERDWRELEAINAFLLNPPLRAVASA